MNPTTNTIVAMGYLSSGKACAEKDVNSLLSHRNPFALAAVVSWIINPLTTLEPSSQHLCMKPDQHKLCVPEKLVYSQTVDYNSSFQCNPSLVEDLCANYNKKSHDDTNIPSTLFRNQTLNLRLTKIIWNKKQKTKERARDGVRNLNTLCFTFSWSKRPDPAPMKRTVLHQTRIWPRELFLIP